jgi:hypothetical protein
MQEGIGHIELFKGPIEIKSNGKNEVHGSWFNDRAERLGIVNSISLVEAFSNELGLEPVYSAIGLLF